MRKTITVLLCAALCAALSVGASAATCEHDWEETGRVNATCETAGSRSLECSECGATMSEPINALGHKWKKVGNNITDPSCTEKGSAKYECENTDCDAEDVRDVEALGHIWNGGTVTTSASCATNGVKTFTCTRGDCGENKTESVEKLGHDWKFVSSSATCEAAGEATYKCKRTNCGEVELRAEAKKDHDMSIITGGPTCTTRGKYTRECSLCGYKKTDTSYTAALGHEVPKTGSGKFTVTTKATCDTNGEKKGKCSVCKEYVYEEIPATGHDFEGDLFITKVPTSSATGKYYAVCSDCDETVTKTIAKKTTNLSKYTVPPVTSSVNNSIVEKGTVVELSCDLPGATIYYTTNGKSPTSASYRTEYDDGIEIKATCTLKAVAVYEKNDDISPSAVFTKTFVVKAEETTATTPATTAPTTPATTATTKEEPAAPEPAVKDVTIKMTIENKTAYVNGEAKELDALPVIKNDRTMLPIRFVAETLGAVIGWNDSTRTVTIVSKTTTIKIVIDKDTATVKTGKTERTVKLDCAAYIDPTTERTYVPVRFVAENLGAEVGWDEATRTVTLKT